jgi:putative endopeptidase
MAVHNDPFIDFDEYVNGEWKNNTKIPDDQVDWGTFNILNEDNMKRSADILNSFSYEDDNKAIGLLFKSLLKKDNEHTNTLRYNLHKYLSIVDDIKTLKDVGSVLGFLIIIDVKPFVNISAMEDLKDTEFVRMTMYNPNISLPEKEYYIDPNLTHFVESLRYTIMDTMKYVYKNRITIDEISNIANDSLIIEELLAIIFRPIEQRREIDKFYFKTTINEFIDNINESIKEHNIKTLEIGELWRSLFQMAMLDSAQEIIIFDIEFFQKLSVMLESVGLKKIKNYIKYVIVRDMGSRVNHQIDKHIFNLFGEKLLGQIAMSERTKTVVRYLNDTIIGEIIGRRYVDNFFDNESKIYVNKMIDCIKNQMEKSLKSLTWLTQPTKDQALLKLKNFKPKIGHPNKWSDHSLLNSLLKKYIVKNNIPSEYLLDAICELKLYSFKMNVINVIDKPRDDDKWHMNVHEVNAYYNPQCNEIVFPAGILQPPFFDKNMSIFKNYGFIGTVIGHEIIHGYDDQGRKVNYKGNQVNWWNDVDIEKFTLVTDKIVKQYESYDINGRKINGLLTLGENIADIGGISLAYGAVIDNCLKNNIQYTLSDERDFFKSYAKLWRINTRPEKLLMKILSDPHSPNKYRVFALRNFDAFYRAFEKESHIDFSHIKDKKDIMYLHPDDRIVIW